MRGSPLFVKGNKLGPGRPKGSKNSETKNYLDLQIWSKMILDATQDFTPKEKLDVGFRFLALLFTKIANIPGSPIQSVENVKEAMKEFEEEKKPEEVHAPHI